MLPVQGPSGTLNAITRAGSPVAYTVQTIKGIQYAFFTAATGTYQATLLLDRGNAVRPELTGVFAPPLGGRAAAGEVDDVVPDRARKIAEVGELPDARLVEPEDRPRRRA